MSFTWGFKATFAGEFARLDQGQQDKVLDFTDLFEAHGLADFTYGSARVSLRSYYYPRYALCSGGSGGYVPCYLLLRLFTSYLIMETPRKLFSERKYIGSGEDVVLPMDIDAPEQEQPEDEECLENIE